MRPAALLLLVALALVGCASDDDDEGAGTGTVEVVVTDKATGKPAAEAEADRASRIKSHIDSSDVVRVFPPTTVLDGDVREQPKGSPERALLEWWQAFQFRDVVTVEALTSRLTLDVIHRRLLARLVRRTGLQGIETLGALVTGDAASVQAGLLNFSHAKGEPVPKTPTASKPATFMMAREDGEWKFAETPYLQQKLEGLRK
jgi:hypothetical protein